MISFVFEVEGSESTNTITIQRVVDRRKWEVRFHLTGAPPVLDIFNRQTLRTSEEVLSWFGENFLALSRDGFCEKMIKSELSEDVHDDEISILSDLIFTLFGIVLQVDTEKSAAGSSSSLN